MQINADFIRPTVGSFIFPTLIFLSVLSLLSTAQAQETQPNCDQNLFKIGKKLRLYEIVTGKLPEKLSDLYTRGFVKQLDDFQCSKTETGIEHGGEIDAKTDFELQPEPGTEETDPILVTKATSGIQQRALLRNGEIIDWGKEETSEEEDTVLAEQPPTSDQPRSEAQKKLDQELLEAAQKGELDRVKEALRAGADVNAKGKGGSTALGWAASKGYEDMVRLLIKTGADIEWEAPQGQTALHVAAHQGQAEVIRILLSSGADVNQKIKSTTAPKHYQGATALFMAVENNKADAIQVLLQSGANVNSTNSFGVTPLMFSLDSETLEPLRTLIEAGADLNAKIKANAGPGAGSTALIGAVIQGNLVAAKVLILAGADVKAKDAEGNTAFDHATKKGDTDIVRILREPGEAIRLAKKGLEPAMMNAIEKGDTSIVKWLLQLGLNANASDEKGITALMLAIENGSVEMVRALLNSGADVNASDSEFGATPLIMAALKNKGEIAKLLIQSGAEVNRQAKGDNRGEGAGWTALIAAAMAGDIDLVSHLLSSGAKAGLTNSEGESALDIAKKEGKLEVVAQLETASKSKTSGGVDSDLVGPWKFGRVNGPFLCNINLTSAKGEFGNIIKSCHPNESFWLLENEELVFLNKNGKAMSRFRKEKEKNYWQGPYLPDSRITHYIKRDGQPIQWKQKR
jgi:ankyrin repeat protein